MNTYYVLGVVGGVELSSEQLVMNPFSSTFSSSLSPSLSRSPLYPLRGS